MNYFNIDNSFLQRLMPQQQVQSGQLQGGLLGDASSVADNMAQISQQSMQDAMQAKNQMEQQQDMLSQQTEQQAMQAQKKQEATDNALASIALNVVAPGASNILNEVKAVDDISKGDISLGDVATATKALGGTNGSSSSDSTLKSTQDIGNEIYQKATQGTIFSPSSIEYQKYMLGRY